MSKPITPLLTVDAIIHLIDIPEKSIVLIERRNYPFGWALPGGFVDLGETVEQAVCREALEETGLIVTIVGLLGVYSDPKRDPRGDTVSIIYATEARGIPKGGDDAKNAGIFTANNLPELAFDHAKILADYFGKFG